MTILSLLIAVPFGIFSAIFLVEYSGKGNKFVEVIRLTTETLSGISVYCIRIVRNVVFRKYAGLGIFDFGRSVYIVYYDPSAYYENDGRSA